MFKRYIGLTDEEVKGSRDQYGTNKLERHRQKSLIGRFLENLGDPIIKILLGALLLEVIFTFGNCNLFEIFGIVIAILIATVVSTLSEYGSENAFRKMEEESLKSYAKVFRSGALCEIPADDLVVGDIVLLSRGDRIHADSTLLEGRIEVDQSALNGENREVEKLPGVSREWELSDKSSVFRGSIITSGEGIGRVERIGAKTYYGMVAADVQAETRESPLKLRLSSLASAISKLGYIVAILVGITYLFSVFVVDNRFDFEYIKASFCDLRFVFTTLIRALTLMITVIVVAVPEGLPMMITVVLTANMKRMIKDNILVKKLVGIETSGSLNILFTDKTGTLTTGKLSVDRIITDSGIYKTRVGFEKAGEQYRIMLLNSFYNTSSEITSSGAVGGNSTDRALAQFFDQCKCESRKIKERRPFSSESKISSVTFDDGSVIVKGAPEKIFPKVKSTLSVSGERIMSDLSNVRREYNTAVSRGERVIAVATGHEGEDELTLVCLAVLKDKVRAGVHEAVRGVTKAGIQVVMVTGDNKDTAIGIAEECGIYKSKGGHIAVSSDELALMTDIEVKKILPNIRVVARALPQDKTRLVRLSQELNLVVGMTGDGINDAPSLKLADVGFSMGSGTDIAKSAGDIIILDDSFNAICKAILYGRTIFKSIRKFISFQLVMNLAACGITFIGRFIGVETPITIIQMLWVNIIMDTLGGLAFAGEAPMKYYMKEKPKRRDEPILSSGMIWQILLNGGYTLFLLILFLTHDFFKGIYPGTDRHLTAFYALFIFSGIFNCLCARSERLWILHGIFKNKLFIGIMCFISAIQIVIVYFGGSLFRSIPLSPIELLAVVCVSFTVVIFDSIRRVFCKLS